MAWPRSRKILLFSVAASAAFTAFGHVSFWDLAKEKHSQDVEAAGKRWGWNVSPALLGASPGRWAQILLPHLVFEHKCICFGLDVISCCHGSWWGVTDKSQDIMVLTFSLWKPKYYDSLGFCPGFWRKRVCVNMACVCNLRSICYSVSSVDFWSHWLFLA